MRTGSEKTSQNGNSMKNPPSLKSSAPSDVSVSERIRVQIDAGFAGVEKARQMHQVGSRDAAAEAVETVRKIILQVRTLLPAASFSESQLGVVNKKIQALKDAAERMSIPK
jgi:hypothetical protein